LTTPYYFTTPPSLFDQTKTYTIVASGLNNDTYKYLTYYIPDPSTVVDYPSGGSNYNTKFTISIQQDGKYYIYSGNNYLSKLIYGTYGTQYGINATSSKYKWTIDKLPNSTYYTIRDSENLYLNASATGGLYYTTVENQNSYWIITSSPALTTPVLTTPALTTPAVTPISYFINFS
jgi:hypothetical protein